MFFFLFKSILLNVFQIILLLLPLILSVAFLTLTERKVLAAVQRRKGPNLVGFWGLLQPFADGVKLVLKEVVLPLVSDKLIFFFAPLLTFFLSLTIWTIIPLNEVAVVSDLDFGLLFFLAISSFSVYGVIFAGWASNSRYAFLGSLRSAAQMISYEISIGLIQLSVILMVGSLRFLDIVAAQASCWFLIPFFPLFLMYFISVLAETNRPPFDLPEAEGELVAGYNVEYSAVGFALFFIAEYANIICQSCLIVLFFFGGWLPFTDLILSSFCFIFKVLFILFCFIWIRSAFPRYRYDHLMFIGWKVFFPLSLMLFLEVATFLFFFDLIPTKFF